MSPRIGVFDSGIGGLSVLRHMQRHLAADYRYVADSSHAPWGDRSPDWVRERSLAIAHWLHREGADALVIACNTATALAAEAVRQALPIPVVAMEPAIKPAATLSRSGQVAVLATRATLSSRRYADLKARHGANTCFHERAPHHWIEAVESGRHTSPEFRGRLEQDLAPLRAAGVDTWVLACTHFPFLTESIRLVVEAEAYIIDPAPAVTAQLGRVLGLPVTPLPDTATAILFTGAEVAPLSARLPQLGVLGEVRRLSGVG